jgi:group I intron endonuclease
MSTEQHRAYGVIYVLTNKVNGKKYVGQTIMDVELRFSKHCLKSQNKSRIHYAIQKYGKDNFNVETVVSAQTQKDLDFLEKLFIANSNTTDPRRGYNVTPGGRGGIKTKESAQKAAEKLKGRKIPRESVEKMAATKRNRPRTPAEQTVLDRMIEMAKGRKHSPEAKKKMSDARIGRVMPPCPDEVKKKLSEAAKRQWALGRGHSQLHQTTKTNKSATLI